MFDCPPSKNTWVAAETGVIKKNETAKRANPNNHDRLRMFSISVFLCFSIVTVDGGTVILSAAKDLVRMCDVNEILRCAQDDNAALRMTNASPARDRLRLNAFRR